MLEDIVKPRISHTLWQQNTNGNCKLYPAKNKHKVLQSWYISFLPMQHTKTEEKNNGVVHSSPVHDASCVAELQTANHLVQVGLVFIDSFVGSCREGSTWSASEECARETERASGGGGEVHSDRQKKKHTHIMDNKQDAVELVYWFAKRSEHPQTETYHHNRDA